MSCDALVLKNYLRDSGLTFKQNTKSYIFPCPKCSKSDKLYIRKTDGRFICWSCAETDGYRGAVEYALTDLLNIPVRQVQAALYGLELVSSDLYLDIKLTDWFSDEDEIDEEAKEIPTLTWPVDYFPIDHLSSSKGASYLAWRGIPIDIAKQYGIRYCPFSRRVVFPVESKGQLYGWQERLIVPNTYIDEQGEERSVLKVKSSTGLSRERLLMFADKITGEHAVLTEGPVDAIKCHLAGGAVASMGKAVSRGQIQLLLNSGIKRLYLGLDPDAADEVRRLVKDLFDYVELYELFAPQKGNEKNDLGGMTFEEVHELFLAAPRIGAGKLFFYLR